jgi:type II secretory pathway pseudopilin PulG
MCKSNGPRRPAAGFTLLEVIYVIVMAVVLASIAMMKLVTPGTLTLHGQAQSLADVVRRAQSLAMMRGQRMSASVTTSGANGTLSITCATGTTPCNTDTSFTVSQDVAVAGSSAVYFNTLGQPVDNAGVARTTDANFTVSYGGSTFTVTVAAITGRVSLSP